MLLRSILLVLLSGVFIPHARADDKTWIILNNNFKGAISLNFNQDYPCLTRPLLEEWGVRHMLLDQLKWTKQYCLTKHSAEQFSFKLWYRPEAGLLTLLFPEEAINPQQNGVATSRWDDGITALFSNYRLDIDRQRARYSWEQSGSDATIVLDNGLNVGPWRLRYQNTIWRDRKGNHGSYTRSYSLWRSIRALRARLTMGDGTTSGAMFDSFSFRGAALASDESMYPDSWRSFTPWINGYARSEAEVTIHQNGERVYRIHVPPGSFTINDFYPPDPQGNLELTVQESDGSERTRTLPWSVMPNLTGDRVFNYELTGGRYKPWMGSDKDRFLQSTFAWGVGWGTTLFAGLQQGEDYASQVAGIGKNLAGLGALSADISSARYTQQEKTLRGEVLRLRYAKAFFTTRTNVTASLQWYPKNGSYRTLEEKISRADMLRYDWDDDNGARAIHGQSEINQSFNEDSTLSLTWDWTRSRKQHASRQSLTLNLNTRWKELDISLYGGRERYQSNPAEMVLGLNFSVPLSLGSHTVNAGYVSEIQSRGQDSQGINLYGSALSDYSMRYDVTAQHVAHGDDELKMSARYQYNSGEANLSMTRGGKQRDYHLDISGSLLAHRGGIVTGQQMGDTMALVDIPGTSGVAFYNQFGSVTNASGEMLVSYMTPWRVNRITVDTYNLPDGVKLENQELEVVPTSGAVVKVGF
ncbi:fimbrial biogenesis outer membrane usher protein [Enterobacteriaceae bacterium H20N1]|uniref:Fimbrial biogenesis outer membrane usher protein n=1 Tax=Dryocola boscaweniae TaxID=2925397 RepID=A0A9X3AC06_9ENTR|nr:fimbria/pilus outer membrane usher protein [Dryocola boscaweniae]MCT4703084.1 fimbrial biogenesis outer membrane usher protein [Dryocola boscaweniae]MCT4720252.1 fimbrial biogenesis outer membrane usher protein [Dryocola boscaweniae]